MYLTEQPASEYHPNHKMQEFAADIWAENETVVFHVELLAQSQDIAEAYIRKVYPNISTLYCWNKKD